MKRLLLQLLAALPLPIAVNAESYWLAQSWKSGSSGSLEKIKMESLEQCEIEGVKWGNTILTKEEKISKKEMGSFRQVLFGYHCVIGK